MTDITIYPKPMTPAEREKAQRRIRMIYEELFDLPKVCNKRDSLSSEWVMLSCQLEGIPSYY